MSGFLLLNVEDFAPPQDITKTIQLIKPFCLCCLDRESRMIDLEKCSHTNYLNILNTFDEPELKQFKQLVCVRCHHMLKKINRFQAQIIESHNILLSYDYTDTTENIKKINNLTVQKVVDDLHLLPDLDVTDENSINEQFETNPNEFNMILPAESNMVHNFSPQMQIEPNMEQSIAEEIQNNLNLEQNFSHNFQNESNMERNFVDEIQNSNLQEDFANEFQNESNVEQEFNELHTNSNMEQSFDNILSEAQMSQTQSRLNKNIKTALEILERNNQSFVGLSSQLQFLNGEHLSFLETSLLSKEILTDIPLVPAKNLSTDLGNELINKPLQISTDLGNELINKPLEISTDLGNELINNSKSLEIEIDGTDKIFYNSLDLSPDLIRKDSNEDEIMPNINETQVNIQSEVEIKKSSASKLKKKRALVDHSAYVRRVQLTHEELDRERVSQAQSAGYLKYNFRCETCIVGFNFKENLEDHLKRKHAPVEGDQIVCDVCSQTIPDPAHGTAHLYRHHTRYECVKCSRRYQSQDEALHHCRQCGNAASCFKLKKPAAKVRRGKLKHKFNK